MQWKANCRRHYRHRLFAASVNNISIGVETHCACSPARTNTQNLHTPLQWAAVCRCSPCWSGSAGQCFLCLSVEVTTDSKARVVSHNPQWSPASPAPPSCTEEVDVLCCGRFLLALRQSGGQGSPSRPPPPPSALTSSSVSSSRLGTQTEGPRSPPLLLWAVWLTRARVVRTQGTGCGLPEGSGQEDFGC